MNKQCRECEQVLPFSEFYAHSRMADGRLNYCKLCVKSRISRKRWENIEKERERDRERHRASSKRQKRLRDFSRLSRLDQTKNKAWQITSNAIRDGKLIRPNECSQCDAACKPEAHHPDYSRPLDVIWLCRSCHCRLHRLESLLVSET